MTLDGEAYRWGMWMPEGVEEGHNNSTSVTDVEFVRAFESREREARLGE